MKNLVSLLMLVLICTSSSGQQLGASLKIYSVNLFIETSNDVSCARFMDAFNRMIDTSVCYSADTLKAMDNYLNQINYLKKSKNFNARIKFIYINKLGKATDICMNMLNICVNGHAIKYYPEFRLYLLSLVPKKQLVDTHH